MKSVLSCPREAQAQRPLARCRSDLQLRTECRLVSSGLQLGTRNPRRDSDGYLVDSSSLEVFPSFLLGAEVLTEGLTIQRPAKLNVVQLEALPGEYTGAPRGRQVAHHHTVPLLARKRAAGIRIQHELLEEGRPSSGEASSRRPNYVLYGLTATRFNKLTVITRRR